MKYPVILFALGFSLLSLPAMAQPKPHPMRSAGCYGHHNRKEAKHLRRHKKDMANTTATTNASATSTP